MSDTLLELTATEAAQAIKNKEISSVELVTATLENAKKQADLNAYITLDEAGSLQRAQEIDAGIKSGELTGKLLGVPICIKDNIEVSGLPNTAGTPALENFIPDEDAPVITPLKREGAIIIGKTNMHELAFGITSNNTHYGAVGNPYKPDHFAGGSSGGTGSAIAGRMAAAGLGTDTGGSIRIPAAVNGLYGYRPTLHRYSQESITPISSTRDTPGPLARNMSDLILIDSAILNHDPVFTPRDPASIRLAVPRKYYFDNLDTEVAENIEASLKKLQDAGVEIIDLDVPDLKEKLEGLDFAVAIFEVKVLLEKYLKESVKGKISLEQLVADIASPDVKEIFNQAVMGEHYPTKEVYDHVINEKLPQFKFAYRQYFMLHGIDACIFPTVPVTARPIIGSDAEIEVNGVSLPTFLTVTQNTAPGSMAGIPSICLPSGLTSDGLPISVGLDGPENNDLELLQIGLTLEHILGKIPPPA